MGIHSRARPTIASLLVSCIQHLYNVEQSLQKYLLRFEKYIKGFSIRTSQLFFINKTQAIRHLCMELAIVHTATAGSSAAVDSLDPSFDDLFTLFAGNDRYKYI